jgi:hypothetical protein
MRWAKVSFFISGPSASHFSQFHADMRQTDNIEGSCCTAAGLPDGLFSYQKSQFGYISEGFGMEKAGIFYDH